MSLLSLLFNPPERGHRCTPLSPEARIHIYQDRVSKSNEEECQTEVLNRRKADGFAFKAQWMKDQKRMNGRRRIAMRKARAKTHAKRPK